MHFIMLAEWDGVGTCLELMCMAVVEITACLLGLIFLELKWVDVISLIQCQVRAIRWIVRMLGNY
jgi:hypothetical protein